MCESEDEMEEVLRLGKNGHSRWTARAVLRDLRVPCFITEVGKKLLP